MAARIRIRKPCKKITVPLATGAVGSYGEAVGAIPGTFTCAPMGSVTNQHNLGTAIEDYSQTAGDTEVQIELFNKADLEYFANATDSGAVVLATDFLKKVYFSAPGVVSKSANNGSGLNYGIAGVVYDVHPIDGVGIKPISSELGALLS